MLKIGITGNIGSGKTTICRVFELLGIPVFYSDDAARQVMTTDKQLIEALKQHFGNEAYFNNGALNKKLISSIVFNNAAELNKLNSLVHPAVFRAFDAWIINHTDAPYVLKEAAILFESGSYKDCDHTILVTAPTPTRLQRVMERDNITIEQAEARNSKQMPQEEKEKLADYIINNDNSVPVIPQVLNLHKLFTRQ
ncbi:dephospho-CoA kinase [uncultured Mucilaginibacter sp.]|uniref:dephospho-CoA kinase n=1 Tax=uncultured Mucilaginibacter sp. TaxID=797541 RepID=UPI0025E10796|nr:dephospho-CoA kinase [uncultured Mucilaginibacter sp.]